MSGLKSLACRLFCVLVGLVLLGNTIPPVPRLAMPLASQEAIDKWFVPTGNSGPINMDDMALAPDVIKATIGALATSSDITTTLTTIYLPIISNPSNVCGKITANTTWTATANPYLVTCDVSVAAGVTLTISAGVVVRFEHIDSSLIISGTLQAVGTETAPIRFQPESGTTSGSWGSVAFLPGSSGVLEHTFLEYGGSNEGMVYIASDAVQVLSSVVRYSAQTGIVIEAASPLISGTQIMMNTDITGEGGGLYNDSGNPTIQNNSFTGNKASYGGGLYNDSGNPTIQNNTFTGNEADDDFGDGGGLLNFSGNPIIQNNTFTGNQAGEDGGGLYNHTGKPTIQNNTFTGNWSHIGGGLVNSSGSPIIQNNTFSGNTALYSGSGLYNDSGNPIIQDNTFSGNETNYGGGLVNSSGSPIIQNNAFSGNTALYSGGGLYNSSGNPTIHNNTFSGNIALYSGGGLYNDYGNPTIQNNTFYSNTASSGGGLYIYGDDPLIRSNIVVNNTASFGGGVYKDTGALTLDHNDVWNNTGGDYYGTTPGTHAISANPLLVDPANGDFHLVRGSPCIDAGDPFDHSPTDFEGDPRPMGLASDIGADEYRTLRVAKIGMPEETSQGTQITYTVTLANLETFTLTNILLTDTLPIETSFTAYQTDGLTCLHDGPAWGGQVTCTLNSLFLAPGESQVLTLTVMLTATFPTHPYKYITNPVTVTASAGEETFKAHDQERTLVTWCAVQLNDTPMESNLQAAIDASTQATDVVKVSGYCRVHDLNLNNTLTLQGGWRDDFSERDPAVYTTTLDGRSLGRVIRVEGNVAPTIEGFIITGGKVSDGPGGGISISSGNPTIQNNSFTGNWADEGGGLYNGSGSPTIQSNTFTSNKGGGLYNYSGSPTIQSNTFTGNKGGGLYNCSGSPIIQNNTFYSNTASSGAGGGLYNFSGSPTIQNNTFSGNSSDMGGGLYNFSGNPTIQNNIFTGNRATNNGGGLSNNTGSPIIQNNTFYSNTASSGAGGGLYIRGLYTAGYNPIIRNNIVVNNTASWGGGIFKLYGTYEPDYNDVWNNAGGDYNNGVTPGAHDISADPLLVDPANGDFHLAPGSPCIDAGDPLNYPPTDFEGDLRPTGLAPDIGADEFRYPLTDNNRRTTALIKAWV